MERLSELACPLCGHHFDPRQHEACGSCPLHGGCGNVCCPACGHTTVDPARSIAVTAARRLIGRLRGRGGSVAPAGPLTLLDVAPGQRVEVVDLYGLQGSRRQRLRAYGLVPGGTVRVLRRSHVTVIEVEQLELAFEAELAAAVHVRNAS